MTDTAMPQRPTVIEWLAAAAAAGGLDALTDDQLVEVDQLAAQIQSDVMQVQVRRHVDAAMNAVDAATGPPRAADGDNRETAEPNSDGFATDEPMTDVMPAVMKGDLV